MLVLSFRIRESGTKNNETDNSIVISKTFCKWNPAICIHDKPLLGITCNNHLKLACLYSEDGICFVSIFQINDY